MPTSELPRKRNGRDTDKGKAVITLSKDEYNHPGFLRIELFVLNYSNFLFLPVVLSSG
jgi:hypothetical protein